MTTKPKSKSKSRTSKNSLTKKAHVPIWAIVLGVLVLVSLGAFFVFKSFASSGANSEATGGVPGSDVTCYRGNCHLNVGRGNQEPKRCYPQGGKPVRYLCV